MTSPVTNELATMYQQTDFDQLNTSHSMQATVTTAWPDGELEWPLSPFSRLASIFMGTLLSTAAGLGTLGNATLFYLIYRFRTLRTRFSLLLLSMSFSDILMSTCAQLVATSTFNGQWMYGNVGCSVYGFLSTLTVLVSIGCLVSIAIWRYMSVYSLQSHYKIYKISRKGIVINLIVIWVTSLIFAISPLIGWNKYILEINMVSCSIDYRSIHWLSKSYIVVLLIWGYVLPIIIMTICYSMLMCLVHRYRREFNRQLTVDIVALTVGKKTKQIRRNLRTSYISGLCIILFLASWTAYGVITVLCLVNHCENMHPLVVTLACFIAKVVTIINPLVYAFCHQNYRNKLSLLFRRRSTRKKCLS